MAVPGNFFVRSQPLSRTYVYKFAVRKGTHYPGRTENALALDKTAKLFEFNQDNVRVVNLLEYVYKVCFDAYGKVTSIYCRGTAFDADAFREALARFEGTHNFSNFCKTVSYRAKREKVESYNQLYENDIDPDVLFKKTVSEASVKLIEPSEADLSSDPRRAHFDRYEVTIRGKSFLHSQVRRMVGICLDVATGKANVEDVDRLLKVKEEGVADFKFTTASPKGLHLLAIEYAPEDLAGATESGDHLPLRPLPGGGTDTNLEIPLIDWYVDLTRYLPPKLLIT